MIQAFAKPHYLSLGFTEDTRIGEHEKEIEDVKDLENKLLIVFLLPFDTAGKVLRIYFRPDQSINLLYTISYLRHSPKFWHHHDKTKLKDKLSLW